MNMYHFKAAKRIFLTGKRFEHNIQAGFRQDFSLDHMPSSVVMRITGRTFYKVYLNGEFVFYGPARAAHDTARVDVIDLCPYVRQGNNTLVIEMAGYNAGNLYVTGEYSFLIAEIECDSQIILRTDENWQGIVLKQKRKYAENFSHARCVSEIYDLDADYYSWQNESNIRFQSLSPQPVEVINDPITFIDRTAALPDLQLIQYSRMLSINNVISAPENERITDLRLMANTIVDPSSQTISERPAIECMNDRDIPFQGKVQMGNAYGITNAQSIEVSTEGTATAIEFDFEEMSSAFPGVEFTCDSDAVIDLIHVDKLTLNGSFDPHNCHCITVIRLHCPAGRFRFEAFEPYGIRYLRLVVRQCHHFTIHDVFMRRCQYPEFKGGSFLCSDSTLNRIFDAARVNLRTNTFDNFVDCPGRERGGWASDSFWTARAAKMLYGDCLVEKAHLENFLSDSTGCHFPDCVPACYPAEKGKACFIQNWTIFLGIELYEYYRRTADRDFFNRHENSIVNMVGTLSKYANKHGVLEELEEIIYVDGTTSSNDLYNRPISTATNALYARMLQQLAEIYDRKDWQQDAEKILEVIRKVCDIKDNREFAAYVPDAFAMDQDGNIVKGKYSSEAAQYFYMWLGLLNPEKLPGFFHIMFNEFGSAPAIPYSNNTRYILRADSLVGTGIRFEVLAQYGEYEKLLHEMTKVYSYMLDNGPGTLWEGWSRDSNINHGYQAHAAVWITRTLLGLSLPDEVDRTIEVSPHPCGRKWAKGYTKAGDGVVAVDWLMKDGSFTLSVSVPDTYRVNLTLPKEIYGWNYTFTVVKTGKMSLLPSANINLTGIESSFVFKATRPCSTKAI